jgi:hypothetical protein
MKKYLGLVLVLLLAVTPSFAVRNTTGGGGGGGISDIVEDTTPQLGGDLDMNSKNIDFPTTANISDVLDEDNMASDSATMLSTQQSIKAYVDATSGLATTLTITDNEDTAENNAIIFSSGGDLDGGNMGLESDGDLTYNPSTGTLSATGFAGNVIGSLTGQADTVATITGLAPDTATTQATQASITTCANLATVGTIGTGAWEGTAVDGAYVDIEGTEIKSTGEGGGTLFLREDGDGTCSWQAAGSGTSGSVNQLLTDDGGGGIDSEAITYNAGLFTLGSDDIDFTATDDGFNFVLGGGAGDDFIVDSTTFVIESDTKSIGIQIADPQIELEIGGNNPRFGLSEADADSGEKAWDFLAQDKGTLYFRALNDTYSAANTWCQVDRDDNDHKIGTIKFFPGAGGVGAGDDFIVDTDVLVVSPDTNTVGIGTTAPAVALDVETNVSANYVANFFNDGNNADRHGIWIQAGSDAGGGGVTMINFYDGDGTTTGSDNISLSGGVISYNTSSDERLKKDIHVLPDGLKRVMDMEPVGYTRKEHGNYGEGFLAQNMKDICPTVVYTAQDERGTMGIDYGKVTPVLARAIQEQQELIVAQAKAIRALEKRLEKLEK